jgi:23S rRNA pseudouridine1911/1915/1917 synthase
VIHKRFKAKKAYARVDHFLKDSLGDISRSRIAQFIAENHVKLNDRPVSKKNLPIREGDVVDMEWEEEEPGTNEYQPSFQLKKLYEDDFLLIIDKPSGISVHPGSGEREETILDLFRFHYPQIETIKDTERPGIVHRLDKDTSGVLLLAKDTMSMKRLQKQFKRREVKKEYLALVQGQMRFKNGTIDAPLARSPRHRTRFQVVRPGEGYGVREKAREAMTEFSVLRQYRDFSLVKLFPLTGRTHQVRVHLCYHGNPVLGDPIYGSAQSFERLALHAYSLEFRHPGSGNVMISYSVFPEVFRNFLRQASSPNSAVARP